MTQIISLLRGGSFVLQVTDRLLTMQPDGRKFDELANKNIIIETGDAIASIGYTGLAFIGKFHTDSWIAWKLSGLSEPDFFDRPQGALMFSNALTGPQGSIFEALSLLIEELKKTEISTSDTHFELVIAGWKGGDRMMAKGRYRPEPFLWIISRESGGDFLLRKDRRTPLRVGEMRWYGSPSRNLAPTAIKELNGRLFETYSWCDGLYDDPIREFEQMVVDRIRAVSKTNKFVGADCLSIVIGRPGERLPIRITLFPQKHHSPPDGGVVDVPETHTAIFTPWIIAKRQVHAPQVVFGGLSTGGAEYGRLVIQFRYAGQWVTGEDEEGRYRSGWEPQARRARPR